MKSYYGNYLGMVINNNDPEYRGRVQIFVPHIMPTLYEGWNQEGEDITINCVGDNMPQGLTTPIVEKLKKILPWAECASPIVGQGISGQVAEAGIVNPVTGAAEPSLILNQTPTATVTGSTSNEECKIPTESGVDTKSLKPGFVTRLNSLYAEATALGYKITCSSGYRSTEKQKALYQADIARNGGKPSGAVARPGYSAHEIGIAVDLKVTGNGVSITQISAAAERNGTNRDTPEWRALCAKHGLHAPLHPKNVPTASVPESWHLEPIETPKAKQGDRVAVPRMVAEKLSDNSVKIGETTSSSQFPPLPNPTEQSTPSNTDGALAVDSKTGKTPVLSPSSAAAAASVALTSGPNTGSAAEGGTNQLAKDRIAYFGPELKDPELLNRIEFVTKKEGGASGHLILETACNRAFFSNRTLKEVVFEKEYFKDAAKGDPNATKTVPYTQFTLDIIKKVIYNGANETDLATDQAYNDSNLYAKKFIDGGSQGSWFDLNTGKKITDPSRIVQLSTTKGNGQQEYIYQKSGFDKNASSKAGHRAKAYGIRYGIKPTSPSTFTMDTPLPKELEAARQSALTKEPIGTNKPPEIVNNTDKHGPTIIKNTNDSAKGLFAFPGVGAMVWVFFREGNPLFPVYFAASYSSNEWKSAYNGNSLNPEGTNQGSVGTQAANSMKLNPNAGGGLEFTHIKDTSDPSGAGDKTVAMMYGDDGSNIVFAKGYHQIYSRHDRRDQIDGHLHSITHGAEERWVEEDSSVNIRGNVFIKIGKVDAESMEAMKELSDFSKKLNDTLLTNSSK